MHTRQLELPLFNDFHQPALQQCNVMRSAFVETHKWQEFHENGQLWIDGEIAVITEMSKHLYDYRTGFKGYEGKPVCRIGVWTKYFDNGQIAWQLDFGDGMFDSKEPRKTFPSFRKDGTLIVRS